MTDRIIIGLLFVTLGWTGLISEPPKLSMHQTMMIKQKEKVCAKKTLKAQTKAKCKQWGYD